LGARVGLRFACPLGGEWGLCFACPLGRKGECVIKHWFILVLFFVGVLWTIQKNIAPRVTTSVEDGELAKVKPSQKFVNSRYYLLQNEKETFFIESEEANIIQKDLSFKKPTGRYLGDEIPEPFNFFADYGEFSYEMRRLLLKDNVLLKYLGHQLNSDQGIYFLKKQYYMARGNVKSQSIDQVTKDRLTVTASNLNANLKTESTKFFGDVKGVVKLRKRYLGSYSFFSQELLGMFKSSKIELNQDVKLTKGNLMISAQKSEIFLHNLNKNLKYYVFYDDVYVEQEVFDKGRNQKITRKAYSEQLEGFENGSKIVLTGAPKVIQGSDIIKGTKIILREEANLVEVDNSKSSIIYKGN
jgi:lipopolysaccharide transport protein LptA